jgi:hypothetical protein
MRVLNLQRAPTRACRRATLRPRERATTVTVPLPHPWARVTPVGSTTRPLTRKR